MTGLPCRSVLVVAVLSSVLEECTLDKTEAASGASVLVGIREQGTAVPRLRGPLGLSDAMEFSFAVHPIMVPSVAGGPNVAALPGTATAAC